MAGRDVTGQGRAWQGRARQDRAAQSRVRKGEDNAKDTAGHSTLQEKAKGHSGLRTGQRTGQGGLPVVKMVGYCVERGRAQGRAV